MGNIVNRVFDSSGPEGKVRGTPQQIIEKYLILARDAQLSNDRVSAENFLQHAEHYTRMLAEAQRELAAEQEQRRPHGENGQNGGNGSGYGGGYPGQSQAGAQPQRDGSYRDRPFRDDRADQREEQPDVVTTRPAGMMDFIEELTDSGLVETPETRGRSEQPQPTRPEFPERRDRGPRPDHRSERRRDERPPREPRPETAPEVTEARAPEGQPAIVAPAVDAPKPVEAKRARAPRKPRGDTAGSDDKGPAEAAE